MRRTPARRVEPGSALWRGFLASGSSGHDFMRSLSSPRRKVQLPYIIQCIKTAGKLATTSHPFSPYTMKALIALYENETPFDLRILDPDHPENTAELARRWPVARFPLLVDG